MPPELPLPCPFCGNPPELTHMPIELFNGCIPTRERPAWMIRFAILCCLGPSARSEISEADAIEKWNRRPSPAADEGATADADEAISVAELTTEILNYVWGKPGWGDGDSQVRNDRTNATGLIECALRRHLQRNAVSPKAAQEEPVDPKDIPSLAEIRELLSGEPAVIPKAAGEELEVIQRYGIRINGDELELFKSEAGAFVSYDDHSAAITSIKADMEALAHRWENVAETMMDERIATDKACADTAYHNAKELLALAVSVGEEKDK